MTNIRRYDATNRPVFMTAVCYQRKTHLKGDGDKKLLLSVMREIKVEKPFTMLGYVILDDHFHWMIQLPGRMSGNPQKPGDTLTYDSTPIPDPSGRSGCDPRELPDKVIPPNAADKYTISEIMQSVKLRFTHRFKKLHGIKGNATLWQRRFWDHIARDQEDVNRHLDYIHYNPVKHGHAPKPLDFPFSSFPKYMERGIYAPNWGAIAEPAQLADVTWE
jgi:putative transposase